MKVCQLPVAELRRLLGSAEGAVVGMGPFCVRVRAQIAAFAAFLKHLYADFPLLPKDCLSDFRILLRRPRTLRALVRPQVLFEHDGQSLFKPFPLSHAPPLFEWGLNWCIATCAHQYLLLHAAVLERGGRALILPALPGLGKSTLCAALMLSGWRLLSDEFGLVRVDGTLIPLPRPIPLKNRSIELIRAFSAEAVLGPEFPKTRKGTVAHLRPSAESVERAAEPAIPAWIVFPRFCEGAKRQLTPVPAAYAFLKLATNAFNYEVLGSEGFLWVGRLIRRCRHYNFVYGRLQDALEVLEALA
ncbi:HprK-related kinase A [Methylothermus subterraneus]